jgi:hypothetical protein
VTTVELIKQLQKLPPGIEVRLNGPHDEYEVGIEKVEKRQAQGVYEAACLHVETTDGEG